MNKKEWIQQATDNVLCSADNRVAKEIALSPAVADMQIYDAPIFGFSAADDPAFQTLKQPEAVGPHFLLPMDWLPGARTVISFFLPFTKAVRQGNRQEMDWPSEEWLHGRIEGQKFIGRFSTDLVEQLSGAGEQALSPSLDIRFWAKGGAPGTPAGGDQAPPSFTSNWSERHVAFVCGLGTFGLSKGLITEKGIAGRFGSIVTTRYFEPDERKYSGVYEYCTLCGACVRNCPVGAISLEKGKDHVLCSSFLDITANKYKPRYGCGKCQVRVPCEKSIPKSKQTAALH